MSLYRLIRLAKKTGDRLIVHNETDNSNIVIMDLDNYERLVDFNDPEDDFGFGTDFGGVPPWDPTPEPWVNPLSGATKYPWEDEDEDEPEYGSDEWFETRGRAQQDDWSSIGDLMGERYAELCEEDESVADESLEDDISPFTPEDEETVVPSQPETLPEPTIEPITEPASSLEPESEDEQTILLADEPDVTSVPAPLGEVATAEEPLSDGPVFYEEPT